MSAYPPYAFIPNLFLYWPAWAICRAYFGIIDLVCLAYIVYWGYRKILNVNRDWALAASMSMLAISSINPCIGNGQNTIVYTATLILTLVLSERRRPIVAGLLLGVAMSKISLTLPFLLMFIFRGNRRIVFACMSFMIASTLVLCVWSHSPPLEMLCLWMHRAEQHLGQGYDFSSLLIYMSVNPQVATRVAEVMVLGTAIMLFIFVRDLPLLTLFGLAAGFGRLWTYHRLYDNFILAILLIALAEVAFITRRVSTFSVLAVFGLSLWFFPRALDVPTIHIVHILIWMAAMTVLCRDAVFLHKRAMNGFDSVRRDGIMVNVPVLEESR